MPLFLLTFLYRGLALDDTSSLRRLSYTNTNHLQLLWHFSLQNPLYVTYVLNAHSIRLPSWSFDVLNFVLDYCSANIILFRGKFNIYNEEKIWWGYIFSAAFINIPLRCRNNCWVTLNKRQDSGFLSEHMNDLWRKPKLHALQFLARSRSNYFAFFVVM